MKKLIIWIFVLLIIVYSSFADLSEIRNYYDGDNSGGTVGIDKNNETNATLTGISISATSKLTSQSFDANDGTDYIRSSSNLDNASYTDYTISLWLYPDVQYPPENQYRYVWDYASAAGNRIMLFKTHNGDYGVGQLCMYQTNGDGNNFGDTNFCGGTGTYNAGEWYHIVFGCNKAENRFFMYINNTLVVNQTSAECSLNQYADAPMNFNTYKITPSAGVGFNAKYDEIAIFNSTLSPSNITALWNNSNALYFDNFGGATAPPASNFLITSKDKYDNISINAFTAIINGTNYDTTNGTINTLLTGGLVNITILTNESGGYYEKEYLNYNVSNNLAAELDKYFRILSYEYIGNITYSGSNYVRNLTYIINMTCPSMFSSNILFNVSGNINNTNNIICNNETQIINSSYKSQTEGAKTLNLFFNNSYLPLSNNEIFGNETFIYDLDNPKININFTVPVGFNNHTTNISIRCNDSISPILEYNNTFNGNNYYFKNLTNNTLQSNLTYLINGYNNLTGICSDFFSSTTNTISLNIYAKTFMLIDEADNTAFDVKNVSSARLYFDDNSSYHDFKITNNSYVNFTSLDNEKLRIELGYPNNVFVTRWIDVSLVNEADIRVCANRDTVTHYEQLLVSAIEKEAVLKSVFANCYVAADYTRFAYQDSLILKAFTKSGLYYVYTYDEGSRVFLASVDGSISTYINLDNLEFVMEGYNINILGDSLSFEKYGTSEMRIFYYNIDNDNTALEITITKMDENLEVFSTTETSSPNNFTMYFNYATLNISNSTLFMIQIDKTKADGTIETIKKYFNTNAQTGVTQSGFAFVISFLLMIFGLTISVSRLAFSWFGLLITACAIVTLSFAISAWYVTVLLAMEIIIFVYIFLIMIMKNTPTLA